jgi:hypothetical protein
VAFAKKILPAGTAVGGPHKGTLLNAQATSRKCLIFYKRDDYGVSRVT